MHMLNPHTYVKCAITVHLSCSECRAVHLAPPPAPHTHSSTFPCGMKTYDEEAAVEPMPLLVDWPVTLLASEYRSVSWVSYAVSVVCARVDRGRGHRRLVSVAVAHENANTHNYFKLHCQSTTNKPLTNPLARIGFLKRTALCYY